MNIDLRQLEEFSGRITVNESVPFRDHLGRETPIDCHIDVTYRRSGGEYHFHGEFSGTFDSSCDVCLMPVAQQVASDFDVIVRRGEENADEADDSGDYITVAVNEHEVSLARQIREGLIVSVPIKIVCTEDCKGLCPTCGVNLNHEICTCEQPVDPRWDALRKLRPEDSSGAG